MPAPNAPGVTYSPITSPRKGLSDAGRTPLGTKPTAPVRNPTKYAKDTSIVKEYQNMQESFQRKEEAPKRKTPVWKRVAGKALELGRYTSASELATKIPGIGDDIESGMDYIPGVRTALGVATNPLTYATGGVGGAALAAGGAGLGAWALSDRERGLGLDVPIVPEKYEETAGGIVGGAAGGFGAAKLGQRSAAAAAQNAEANLTRIEQGGLQADDILKTADRGKTFTPRRPTSATPDDFEWHTVKVKNPVRFKHNIEDGSYTLEPVQADAMDTMTSSRVAKALAETGKEPGFTEATLGNDAFEVVSEAVKKSLSQRVPAMIDSGVERALAPTGMRRVYRAGRAIDKAVGRGAAALAPDIIKPAVSTLARPSVGAAGWALANPEKAKDIIKKAFEIDHAVGLKVAQTVIYDWDMDVNVPDWLPVVGDTMNVDTQGIAAEIFRPSNLINFTPAGKGLQAGALFSKVAARQAAEAGLETGVREGVQALGEIAIREGAGNAIFGGMDAWANGGNKEQILLGMVMGFGAGAVLGVPMNVAEPIARHHLGKLWQIVKAAPEGEEPRVLLTAQKHMELEPQDAARDFSDGADAARDAANEAEYLKRQGIPEPPPSDPAERLQRAGMNVPEGQRAVIAGPDDAGDVTNIHQPGRKPETEEEWQAFLDSGQEVINKVKQGENVDLPIEDFEDAKLGRNNTKFRGDDSLLPPETVGLNYKPEVAGFYEKIDPQGAALEPKPGAEGATKAEKFQPGGALENIGGLHAEYDAGGRKIKVSVIPSPNDPKVGFITGLAAEGKGQVSDILDELVADLKAQGFTSIDFRVDAADGRDAARRRMFESLQEKFSAKAAPVEPQTAALSPDDMRQASAARDAGWRGKTKGEVSLMESAPLFESLDADYRVQIGEHVATAIAPEYAPVLQKLAKIPFFGEYLAVTQRALEAAKRIIERAGLSTDVTRNAEHVGIVIRPFVSAAKEAVTPGQTEIIRSMANFSTSPTGRAVLSTDPLAILNVANRVARDPDLKIEVSEWLDNEFPGGYNEVDIAAAIATGTVLTHEPVHSLIKGHEDDFKFIKAAIDQASSDEFGEVFDEDWYVFQKLYDSQEQLNAVSEVINDSIHVDRSQPVNWPPKATAESRAVGSDGGRIEQPTTQPTDSSSVLPEDRGGLGEGTEGSGGGSGIPARPADAGGSAGDGGSGGTSTTSGAPAEPEPDRPKRRTVKVNRVGPDAARLDKATGKPLDKPLKPEQRVQATRKPTPLDDTDDFEVIGSNWETALNGAKIDEAGAGAAFLRTSREVRKATKRGDAVVQPLSDIDDVIAHNFQNNWMKRLAEKFPRVGKIVGGLAAIAKDPWDKAIVAYHVLQGEGETRKFVTMSMLRGEKMPFEPVNFEGEFTGKVKILNSNGKEVITSLGDVFSNPSFYKLDKAQRGYISIVHKVIDDLVDEMRANGVDIKELGVEKRGEHYFPRFVKGKDGFLLEDILDFEKAYAGKAVGAKQPFQKGRVHPTEAAGEADGVVYAPALQALEGFIDAANKTIAAKKVLNSLDKYGISPKDLALEQTGFITIKGKNGRPDRKIASPIYGASAEVRKAQKALDNAVKTLNKARRGKVIVGVTDKGNPSARTIEPERKLSARELSSLINQEEDVIRLRKALADAKGKQKFGSFEKELTPEERAAFKAHDKAKAQYKNLLRHAPQDAINFTEKGKPIVTRIDHAGKVIKTTDKLAKTVSREQLADAAKRVEATRAEVTKIYKAHGRENIEAIGDKLAETLAMKRAEIKAGHEIGRGAQIQVKRQTVSSLENKVRAAREELIDRKFHLRQVADQFRNTLETKRNAITESTALLNEDVVNELGIAGDIVPVRRVASVPGLQGKLFPAQIADAIDAGLREQGLDGAIKSISDLNDKARLLRTGADVGYLFIQGLPILATNPKAWAGAAYHAVKALFNPDDYIKWIQTKQAIIDEMRPFAGAFQGSEYFSDAPGTSFIKKWSQTNVERGAGAAITLPKKIAGKGMAHAAVSFEAFLDASKILMWESMVHGKGMDRAGMEAYGRLIRNLTGTTSTARLGVGKRQRQIEALLMFSPRFTRSVFALVAQGVESGPARKEALKSLGLMMASSVFIFAAAKTAAYETGLTDEPFSPEDLNPENGGKFMSIKMGNNYYGLGGSFRAVAQLAGGVGAGVFDPERFISTQSSGKDSNPFLKYMRGRGSPAAGAGVDMITGKTVIGEDVTDRKDYLTRLPDQYIPFVVSSWMDTEGGMAEKFGTSAGQLTGLRTYPESASEDLNRAVQKYAPDKDITGWSNLTAMQKTEMLIKHPEVQRLLDKKEAASWTGVKQLTMEYEKKKAALGARWLKTQAQGGEKLTSDDLTSEEYRDALKTLNAQKSAAQSALIGDKDYTPSHQTPRQKLMSIYYDYVDKSKYTREDGTIDWDIRDKLESDFMSQLNSEEQKIVHEETAGTSKLDPVERRYKESYQKLKPYFDIRDEVAQSMGLESALEASLSDEATQKQYNKLVTSAQEQWRISNPELDGLLQIWGYVSTTMADREPKSSKIGHFKVKRVSRPSRPKR